MKTLSLSKLNELFAAIATAQKLYIPAEDAAGQAQFTVWQEGMALSRRLNTVRSAKDLFFPQVENLMGFKVTDCQIELIETRDPAEDFVLFGVRACDCRSFDVLDRVFLSEPVDSYYQSRREHGTVITMACTRPAETCFCGAFGIDAANPAGDVSCWMEGEALYWRANTPKGETLTAQLPMLSDCDADGTPALEVDFDRDELGAVPGPAELLLRATAANILSSIALSADEKYLAIGGADRIGSVHVIKIPENL